MQLSEGCRNLLDRIFEPNVKQRIKVDEIMQHPWYLQPLPSQYQSQLQHLEEVQRSKDAHIQSRQLDPVRLCMPLPCCAAADSKPSGIVFEVLCSDLVGQLNACFVPWLICMHILIHSILC